MRINRFYVEQPLGEEIVLQEKDIVHQCVNVFRMEKGERITLFNGKEAIDYLYKIKATGKRSLTLTCIQTNENLSLGGNETFLFISCIKKDLFELVVQKSVELGVTHIVPLITERTTTRKFSQERLNTIVKEATEQSGRGILCKIHEMLHFKDILNFISTNNIEITSAYVASLLAEQSVAPSFTKNKDSVACFIGPEGGWSEKEEIFFMRNNFPTFSFGKNTLRAETAAIICAYLASR